MPLVSYQLSPHTPEVFLSAAEKKEMPTEPHCQTSDAIRAKDGYYDYPTRKEGVVKP